MRPWSIRNPVFNRAYKGYVLTTLTLVYTIGSLDQGLMSLLLQPIKDDLHLTDTQLGFLTGVAFGLFYAMAGLPVARWADRGNRATITSIAIALWGGTVMLCVLVTNFAQLALARMAAAIGGASCMPPTYSLVGDYFVTAAERTRAMAVYMAANSLSAIVSFIAGGWLNERYGWRTTFFLLGIPGLMVAILVTMTIAEPRKHLSRAQIQRAFPRMTEVFSILWHQQSARHLIIAVILVFMMGWGLFPWYGAFMMRSHGLSTGELGIWLGLIFGVAGTAGVLLGGHAAGRWFGQDERGQMRLLAVSMASLAPGVALFLFLSGTLPALIALTVTTVVLNVFFGPTFAILQRLVVDEMRATTLAVTMLLANAIGIGVGPQAVGVLSDLLRPELGSDSLRYAMLIISFVALWAAYHFWRVGRTIEKDLSAVARHNELDGSGPYGAVSNPAPPG